MVTEGKYVAIHYTGTFDDGQVFDSSLDGTPFEFQIGAGMVIPGLDKGVVGMKLDEEKDIVVIPEDGYGDYDENLLYAFPLEEVKQQFKPEIGMTIALQMDNGSQIPAVIKEIGNDEVVVDMNHPLAGKTLHFHIKVINISDSPEYSNNGCDGCGGSHEGCSC
ncbi:MAG TPA: peptidylprolyl isomerase [Spirochaetota bacterium]|nr:peptidylprolyl isomerase [Spirochaetota bacterium]